MAALWITVGHYLGDSLTNPMLMISTRRSLKALYQGWVGFLSPEEHLMGFEPGTFRL